MAWKPPFAKPSQSQRTITLSKGYYEHWGRFADGLDSVFAQFEPCYCSILRQQIYADERKFSPKGRVVEGPQECSDCREQGSHARGVYLTHYTSRMKTVRMNEEVRAVVDSTRQSLCFFPTMRCNTRWSLSVSLKSSARITPDAGGFSVLLEFRHGHWYGSSRKSKQFSCFGWDSGLPYELQQFALLQTQVTHFSLNFIQIRIRITNIQNKPIYYNGYILS